MAMLRASAGSSRSLFDEGAHRLPESADRKVLERESRQWKEREDRAKSAVQQNRQSAALWESRVADSELARQQSEEKFLTVIADVDSARQRHHEAQQKQQDSAAPTWYHQ